MSLSTNLVAGLSSGFDWRSMIDQLMKVESRRVDLVKNQKTEYEQKLSEWQSFNTKLLSLKTAASALTDPGSFDVYLSNLSSDNSAVNASDLLSASTTSSAAKGSYTIVVDALATAEKLSSRSFSNFSEALGDAYAGDVVINGRAVTVNASDSLADVRNRINNANSGASPTGVTASIVSYGTNDHRLLLTSDNTGAQGIGLQNASASDLVQLFGWKDKASSLKNSITGGAQSDGFSGSTQSVKSLLGLSTTQSGAIQIMDGLGVYQNVSVDLSSDSLEDFKTAVNNAAIEGVTASVVPETAGGATTYKLRISGSQHFVDSQNILETLGVLQSGVSEVQGTTSGNGMTSNGLAITSSTLLIEIDGYHQYTAGDRISLGAESTDHGGRNVSGDILAITENTTVQDLLDAVEAAYEVDGHDVSVYLTSDGKIQVADQESGESSLKVNLQSTIGDGYSSLDWGTFTDIAEIRKRQITAGADASLDIDGVTVTSRENAVKDVLPGVTLNLLKADSETTLTLNVDRDIDAVMNKIQSFVDAYNAVSAYLKQQQSYDQENGEKGGILFGDGTLFSIKLDLTSLLTRQVRAVSSDLSTMGLAGIEVDKEGQLSINDGKLRGYLETRFNDIKLLFSVNGTTDAGSLNYLLSSRETQAGEYTVNITQAATRSATTSDTSVSDTLENDEILTITQDGRTANVSLMSDMTISAVIHAVNTEMAKEYAAKLAGGEEVTGSGSAITSAALWENIDGANLVNGDVITFTGTGRNGGSVSGSYTISDTAADTVQGLLSEIESAYGGKVSASIDGFGRLVITDKQEGSSKLSLSLDYSGTQNQVDIFGAVSAANEGGQEGRWTMNITASNDGTGHLVLTHDSFGSSFGFTVEESRDDGLWSGSQTTPVTVNTGTDVAGTINGEAATGSGQILTGNSGEANVEGLALRYSGSATGDVGSVTVTLGIAELFERALHNIADPYAGYLAFKQDSLQSSIDGFGTRIDQMEVRLDRKMENMVNRFVVMELALARIQSQSQWLSGQISASLNGWGWQ